MTESLADRFETTDLPESVDEAAVDRLATVAHLLDECVRLPGGVSVGLDPLLNVVPVVGDALSAGLSLYIVGEAAYLGVPYTTVVRMLGNVAVDVVGGAVPVVGVVFDAFWRANRRNVELVLDELAVETHQPVESEPTADGTGDATTGDDPDTGGITIEVGTETDD
ncbi:MAG: hypothetical protein J07HB67_02223 [halophilic archaeon J07HB67]|jgi:hypothetical protein|nr:MAG: hypothetical protein J07HB67_02223 [halophilic archaeon J07HB67]